MAVVSRSCSLASRSEVRQVLNAQGRYDEALKLYEEVVQIDLTTLGPGHASVAATLNNMALVCAFAHRIDVFSLGRCSKSKIISQKLSYGIVRHSESSRRLYPRDTRLLVSHSGTSAISTKEQEKLPRQLIYISRPCKSSKIDLARSIHTQRR